MTTALLLTGAAGAGPTILAQVITTMITFLLVMWVLKAFALKPILLLLEDRRNGIGFNRIITDSRIAKISVVGVGMKSHAGVASTMFKALADRGINIQAITTSEIKVSVLIDEDETELAVRVLHTAYGLDAEDEAA